MLFHRRNRRCCSAARCMQRASGAVHRGRQLCLHLPVPFAAPGDPRCDARNPSSAHQDHQGVFKRGCTAHLAGATGRSRSCACSSLNQIFCSHPGEKATQVVGVRTPDCRCGCSRSTSTSRSISEDSKQGGIIGQPWSEGAHTSKRCYKGIGTSAWAGDTRRHAQGAAAKVVHRRLTVLYLSGCW
jgi:hypothetical protein